MAPIIHVVVDGQRRGKISPSGLQRTREPVFEKDQIPGRLYYRSHIEAPSLQGQGVGTMLCILMAKTIYDRGGLMYSSDFPGPDARAMWERMVKFGWAEKLDSAVFPNQFVYRFKPSLLETHFFESLKEKAKEVDYWD